MVIQRTIEQLRERPRHERRAVALGVAGGVMAVLFFAWIVFFVRNAQSEIRYTPNDQLTNLAQDVQDTYSSSVNAAAVGAAQPESDAQVVQIGSDPTQDFVQ